MIVKDEAPIIEDCLRNVCDKLPITYWAISDTGSTDGTQDIIRNFFEKEGIPGELHEDEWKGFDHNRTVAYTYAKGHGDYVFFIDADDRLKGEVPLPENPTKDAYYLELKSGVIAWDRIFLVRSDWDWVWVGRVHEFLSRPQPGMGYTSEKIVGDYNVVPGHFGNRSQQPAEVKYGKDAIAIEEAYNELEESGEDIWGLKPRYAFYCGQSYRNCKDWEKTIYWYKKRTELGGWREEIMHAYLELGHAYLKNGQRAEAITAWLDGYAFDPTRAECIYQLGKLAYEEDNLINAYMYMKQAASIPYPKNDTLFVQHQVYDHKIDYILSIVTFYYHSKYQIAFDHDELLKTFRNLFEHRGSYTVENIMSNMEFYFPNKTRAELFTLLLGEKKTKLEANEI